MSTNTIVLIPADAAEADAVTEVLKRLRGANMKLGSSGSWQLVPVFQSLEVTDKEITMEFSPGVLELLGRDLPALDLLKAADESVRH